MGVELGQMIKAVTGHLVSERLIADNKFSLQLAAAADHHWAKLKPLGQTWADAMGLALTNQLLKPLNLSVSETHPPPADAKPTTVNNHFHGKIEVPAKDPDRWIRDLSEFAAKQVRAPRRAKSALGGGGL
jgi:hypothetical protein